MLTNFDCIFVLLALPIDPLHFKPFVHLPFPYNSRNSHTWPFIVSCKIITDQTFQSLFLKDPILLAMDSKQKAAEMLPQLGHICSIQVVDTSWLGRETLSACLRYICTGHGPPQRENPSSCSGSLGPAVSCLRCYKKRLLLYVAIQSKNKRWKLHIDIGADQQKNKVIIVNSECVWQGLSLKHIRKDSRNFCHAELKSLMFFLCIRDILW